jgi:hypothetical protein
MAEFTGEAGGGPGSSHAQRRWGIGGGGGYDEGRCGKQREGYEAADAGWYEHGVTVRTA